MSGVKLVGPGGTQTTTSTGGTGGGGGSATVVVSPVVGNQPTAPGSTNYTQQLSDITTALGRLIPTPVVIPNPLEAGNDVFRAHGIIAANTEYHAESCTITDSGNLKVELGATARVYGTLTLSGTLTLAGELTVGA